MAEHLQQAGQRFACTRSCTTPPGSIRWHPPAWPDPYRPQQPGPARLAGRASARQPGLCLRSCRFGGRRARRCSATGLGARAHPQRELWCGCRCQRRSIAGHAGAVGPAHRLAPGQSLLDALLASGAWTGYECRRGVCGACFDRGGQWQPHPPRQHCACLARPCDVYLCLLGRGAGVGVESLRDRRAK
ncbi:2Fe-2S iron-sulfur cluster-binding protein [Comamonas sp. JC664]|uniref:2Fe-2S iron-sulfur cluster-binding protein n=1 Tax=Comamonas sp. JC664 TaxID=2801917 RepID=UPI003617F32D